MSPKEIWNSYPVANKKLAGFAQKREDTLKQIGKEKDPLQSVQDVMKAVTISASQSTSVSNSVIPVSTMN